MLVIHQKEDAYETSKKIIMWDADSLYDCCRYYNRTTERASGNRGFCH